MKTGRRDRLITFERAASSQAGSGQVQQSWASLGQAWAQIYWGKGEERRAAAADQGSQSASFQVLANPMTRGVTVRDRIVCDGSAWDIAGVLPLGRDGFEFTATRAT